MITELKFGLEKEERERESQIVVYIILIDRAVAPRAEPPQRLHWAVA